MDEEVFGKMILFTSISFKKSYIIKDQIDMLFVNFIIRWTKTSAKTKVFNNNLLNLQLDKLAESLEDIRICPNNNPKKFRRSRKVKKK